jgi:oligoendopeptidase F
VRDWRSEAVDLRGYSQPISFRNLANDLPDAVVDTLLDVCRRNAGLFQRYFRLKARRLGMERLRRYDIYAPFAHSEKTYSYPQAIDMVLNSFRDFSPQMANHVGTVIESQHLDALPRPGKREGAFCYGVLPGMAPWVMVNFSGQARDAATLAHELGHAAHALLAADHSVLTFSASLPLAETASVFSEMLFTDRLLKEEHDTAARIDILSHFIDGAYATLMRQAFFALFERDAHQMIADGRGYDDLCALYLRNLHEQFGDAMEVAGEFKVEWISIPHFYNTPFYTYAYSFGQLLVLSLYQQYRSEGAAFIPRYMRILSAGGSESPVAILEQAGLDVSSPAFWQGGFDVVRGLIDELDRLVSGEA